ncbi:hypothetical protein CP532_1084 [Ophiocordyceps camponoti-leonardi (nom. inval.)]|nr:hypothetical protein CP532_1084 [Ophiocordyceps camponoti-leonardi (nom. inval.)]
MSKLHRHSGPCWPCVRIVGPTRTFMWIRDQVPKEVPGVRAILYGYKSSLLNSESFQGIEDLAIGLIVQMKANGLDESSKPLIFIAHSLGGIVLKSAVRKLANAEDKLSDRRMFSRLKGAVMFGVPNLGMEHNHLLTLIQDRHVRNIVDDLSKLSGKSGYLYSLEQSVSGIAEMRHIKFLWAFETDVSPTLDSNLLGLITELDPSSTNCAIFVSGSLKRLEAEMIDYKEIVANLTVIDLKLIACLRRPELDLRRQEIASQFKYTCEWIFNIEHFASWLRQDEGIFWINGKPGSGKSTLMKFVLQHPRVHDYGYDFSSEVTRITADFFFNFRGSSLQKSFLGLLQSVLHRLLEDLASSDNARPIIDHLLATLPKSTPGETWWTRERMEQALRTVLNQGLAPLSITFFIDALDEVDGNPELLLRFLNYLKKRPPGSLTKTKLCFSSRPWDIFTEAFSRGPSLVVQDFTQNDLRHYCTSTLASTLSNKAFIKPLADEIASRASGVFSLGYACNN